jgi:DHA3 family macrolide efflux protein-like MFS transporter
MGLSQAILQAKVVPHIQGRIFGLRMFLNTLTFTLAYLIGGLLADSFFEPLMAVNGPLAGSVGRLIGVGPGRGMGLMFILMGVLAVFSALSAFAYPRIRRVESEIPDVV